VFDADLRLVVLNWIASI